MSSTCVYLNHKTADSFRAGTAAVLHITLPPTAVTGTEQVLMKEFYGA